MRHISMEHDACPIARSLDVVGDWWTLLIIREAFMGVRRFSDFQRHLGMARNILSTRLKHLTEAGLLEQQPASDGSAYREYSLTQKGRDLLPVLVALRQWGERYSFAPGELYSRLVDRETGHDLQPLIPRTADGRSAGDVDLDVLQAA
jgi:DNA-binding HxlR family transcriptional regulator